MTYAPVTHYSAPGAKNPVASPRTPRKRAISLPVPRAAHTSLPMPVYMRDQMKLKAVPITNSYTISSWGPLVAFIATIALLILLTPFLI